MLEPLGVPWLAAVLCEAHCTPCGEPVVVVGAVAAPPHGVARAQMQAAQANGCVAIGIAPGLTGGNTLDGVLDPGALGKLDGFDAVISWADDDTLRAMRRALAARALDLDGGGGVRD